MMLEEGTSTRRSWEAGSTWERGNSNSNYRDCSLATGRAVVSLYYDVVLMVRSFRFHTLCVSCYQPSITGVAVRRCMKLRHSGRT